MSETSILDAIKELTAQFHELRADVNDLRNQSEGVGCPDDTDDSELGLTSDDSDDDSDDDQDACVNNDCGCCCKLCTSTDGCCKLGTSTNDSDGNQIAVTRSALPWETFKALLLEECEQEDCFGNEREGFYGTISHHRREEATDDPSNLEEVIDAVALFINLGVLPGADRFAKYE